MTTPADPVAILAKTDTEAQNHTTRKHWSKTLGETVEQTYEGLPTKINALYEQFRTLTGNLASYDEMDFDLSKGRATLICRITGNGSVSGWDGLITPKDGELQYELFENQVVRQIQYAPYFQQANDDGAAMTGKQIAQVFDAYDNMTPDEMAAFVGGTSTTKQNQLLYHLLNGVHEYWDSAYIVRKRQVVSDRTQVKADLAGINTVQPLWDLGTSNYIISALTNEQGEWLKRAPQVRILAHNHWEMTQEMWWARDGYSDKLYGGTHSYIWDAE